MYFVMEVSNQILRSKLNQPLTDGYIIKTFTRPFIHDSQTTISNEDTFLPDFIILQLSTDSELIDDNTEEMFIMMSTE